MSRFRRTMMVLASLALVAAPLAALTPAAAAAPAAGDVTSYLGGGGHGNFNPTETAINYATAPKLAQRWAAHSHGTSYIATQPIVSGGVVYWGDGDGYEHATSDATGADLWTLFTGNSGILNPSGAICGPTQLGIEGATTVATIGGQPRLLVTGGGNVDGPQGNGIYLYALNPADGGVVWQTRIGVGPTPGNQADGTVLDTLWAAPQVVGDTVYLGVAAHGSCPHHTISRIMQLSGVNGAVQHNLQLNTALPGVNQPGCIGGDVWGTPTIDTANGRMYIATGDADTSCGDEAWASAIVAISLNTFTVVDFDSAHVNPAADYDFGSTPVLFTGVVGGQSTPMVGMVNKNGTYYAWNRANLAAGPIWTMNIAVPSNQGSIAPAMWDGANLVVAGKAAAGTACAGSAGTLRSIDPGTGAIRWVDCLPAAVLGAPAGAPGIVAVGTGNQIQIVSTITGGLIWRWTSPAANGIWAAPTFANGSLYVATSDGSLRAFAPQAGWSSWTPLPQGTPPGVGAAQAPGVASWGPGRLDLFVKGGDGSLWHSWQPTGTAFSGWENLGGQLTSAPVAVSWAPNRIDVFAQGTDHALWHKWWDGARWSVWQSLGGQLGTDSAPAVASWAAGRLDVVVKGTDNGIWHRWWTGSAWSNWESLGGKCIDDPGAASWSAGALDVFCVGAPPGPPALWHRYFHNGVWSGWVQEVPGGWLKGISVATWAPGRLDVFGSDAATNALAHAWWDGRRWQKEVLDGVMASTPTSTSWSFGRIDVFVLGTDGQIWRKIYS